MPLSKIKKEHEKEVIAFGKGKGTLGERSDIDELAIIAQESKNKNLLNLFETLPSVAELKKAKTEAALPKKEAVKEEAKAEAPKATPNPATEVK